MSYSTADAERIARLEAATRAAKRIVEQAKGEDRPPIGNHQDDCPSGREALASTANRSAAKPTHDVPSVVGLFGE